MRAKHARSLLAALAVAGALGGCGGQGASTTGATASDQAEVRAAVESYLGALRAGDADGVCDLLTRRELQDLDAAGSCAEIMGRGLALIEENGVELPDYELSQISIDGDRAESRLVGGSTDEVIPLTREDGEWKLEGTTSLDQFHPDEPLGDR